VNRESRIIPWCVFILVGIVLHKTRGHYNERYLFALSVTFLIYAVVPAHVVGEPFKKSLAWVGIPLSYFAWRVSKDALLLYAEAGSALRALHFILRCSVATSLATMASLLKRFYIPILPAILMTFALFLQVVARILTLKASSHPVIDVFVTTTLAADYLLKGLNPYTSSYPDLYHGGYGYGGYFGYWPGLLYWVIPFRMLFGDIRWAYLCSDILVATGIYRFSKALGQTTVGAIWMVLLWWSFPPALFVLEQAWIDVSLMVWAILSLVAVIQKRFYLAGLSLAIALSVKQYALIFAVLLVLFVLLTEGFRSAVKVVSLSAIGFVAIMAPFFFWSPSAFIEKTISVIGHNPSRIDALCLNAWWLVRVGADLPKWVVVIPLFLSAPAIWRFTRTPTHTHLFRATAVLYGTLFLFAKQAFCNYYLWVAFFIFLECVVSISGDKSKPESP
jgi:hypothetical protein